MIPYLARLLDITMNNNSTPRDWKQAIVVPIYKGGDRSVVGNYRPVSLTSVVCKQMEHVTAGYLRQVWEMSEWLYEPLYTAHSSHMDNVIIHYSKTYSFWKTDPFYKLVI
jgi:hypothetical protein